MRATNPDDATRPHDWQPPFQLSEEGMQQLMRCGAVRSFPARSVVVHEGDDSDSLYVVLQGRVKVYGSNDEGKEFVFGTVAAGDYFGEMVLDGGPRSASVMTLEDCRFLVVPRHRVDELVELNPRFARDLITRLIRRVRLLTETTLNLAYQDVYGRFAHFVNSNAVPEGERLVIRERLTQADIAARIGGSREMVSRIMADLSAGGYIATSAKRIEICRRLPPRW
jgi:CRP/FNR family cyclic AMP-dependent transcriptional regulator